MNISEFTPDAVVDAKKKNHAWAMIVPGLKTNADYTACFEGRTHESLTRPSTRAQHQRLLPA
jgi:hypothetical protein